MLCYIIFVIMLFLFYWNDSCVMSYMIFVISCFCSTGMVPVFSTIYICHKVVSVLQEWFLYYVLYDICHKLFLFYMNGSCIMSYMIFVIMLFLFYMNGSCIMSYMIFVIMLFLFYMNGSCIMSYMIFVIRLFLF